MNDSQPKNVYKACGEALVALRRTEPTVLLWRSGMSAHVPISQAERRQPEAVTRRLLSRLTRSQSGCWEWGGARNKSGYGKMFANRNLWATHRLAYRLFCGEVPDGTFVCHRCDNPACCNPMHLFLGTPKDNVRDMWDKGRGRPPAGEKHNRAKLTDGDVLELRRLWAAGVPRAEIATRFDLEETTVTRIASGKTWKHLPNSSRVRTKPPTLNAEQVTEAVRMRRDGMSFQRIARSLGVSAMVVFRAVKKACDEE